MIAYGFFSTQYLLSSISTVGFSHPDEAVSQKGAYCGSACCASMGAGSSAAAAPPPQAVNRIAAQAASTMNIRAFLISFSFQA